MELDYLVFGADSNMKYAFRMLHLSGVCEEIQRIRHSENINRVKFLCETLGATMLLGTIGMDEEQLNVKIQYENEIVVSAEVFEKGAGRGYISVQDGGFLTEGLDDGLHIGVPALVKTIRVNKRTSKLFEGVTECESVVFEDLINDHLQKSWQVKSGIRISSFIKNGKIEVFGAAWFELPNLSEVESIRLWEHINSLPALDKLYLENSDPDVLAKSLIPDDLKVVNNVVPRWMCPCSDVIARRVIESLSAFDREELFASDKPLVVGCHFCGKEYVVPKENITNIVD